MQNTKGYDPNEVHAVLISEEEKELLQEITMHDPAQMATHIERIHDLALYHTIIDIEQDDKHSLYVVNLLRQAIQKIT